jgi:hypothetical protein
MDCVPPSACRMVVADRQKGASNSSKSPALPPTTNACMGRRWSHHGRGRHAPTSAHVDGYKKNIRTVACTVRNLLTSQIRHGILFFPFFIAPLASFVSGKLPCPHYFSRVSICHFSKTQLTFLLRTRSRIPPLKTQRIDRLSESHRAGRPSPYQLSSCGGH